jgi:hypothetical protein
MKWIPEACTLPTAQRPLRRAEFDNVFAMARERHRPNATHLRLVLSGPDGLKATVEDLAARENECCAFFAFTVTEPQPGTVLFDIQVPPAYTDVLDALAKRAAAAQGEA